MKDPQPKIITYENDGVVLKQILPWDCDITDCFNAFKKILYAMTFSEHQIESYMDEYQSELLEWYAEVFNNKDEVTDD
jgi:hypothetical protein